MLVMVLVLQGENNMKLICEAYSYAEAKKLIKLDGIGIILFKIDFLSLENSDIISLNNLEKIFYVCKKKHIKIGIYAEKIYHEDDLVYIKMLLKNDLFKNIDYFFYSDMGFYEILVEMGYSTKTVYYAPTYATNSYDVKVLQKLNSYVVASCQISFDELKNMVDECYSQLIVEAFGMACCFYSKRPLVTNYLKFKNYKLNNFQGKIMKIKEETRDNFYHLVEDENGVRVYDENNYALTEKLDEISKVPYLMIHHFNLKSKIYLQVIELYNEYVLNHLSGKNLEKELILLDLKISKSAYDNKTVLLKSEVGE